MLDHVWQDVRYAVRMLRGSPIFTVVAVTSLAIGIGANTTIFTLVNALLVRPRPGIAETGLVDVGRTQDGAGFDNMSYPNYVDYRDASREVLTDLAALRLEPQPIGLSAQGSASRIYAQSVSGNFFDVLGVRPAAGRFFLPEEDNVAGERLVAVLTHRFAADHYATVVSAVGSTMTLNGRVFTVVGVAPERFTGTTVMGPDVWVPLHALTGAGMFKARSAVWLVGVGRLKPGVSPAQAQAVLGTVAARLRQAYPEDNRGQGTTVTWSTSFPGEAGFYVAAFMTLLMALVGLVLLIAGVNVAGMLLARAASRRRELAVRLAIGASRGRLVRQLLTESVLLFVLGGGAGLVLAIWLRNLLLAVVPQLPVPVTLDLSLDLRVLAFAALVSLAAGVLAGLAPALHVTREAVAPVLNADGQGPGARSLRLRNTLVASQVGLALVLVVAAGLFLRALRGAGSIDPGFTPENVEVASLDLRLAELDETAGRALTGALLERVRTVPSVRAASLAVDLPLDGGGKGFGAIRPADHTLPAGERLEIDWNIVTPGFFETMGITIVEGRAFLETDRRGTPPVAIVNQTLARRLWPGKSPIGKHVINPQPDGDLDMEVVGVERNLKYRSLGEAPRPFIYVPLAQRYHEQVTLVVKRAGGPSVIPAVRAIVKQLNPNLPVVEAQALSTYVGIGLLPQRLALSVAGSLGVVGLLLAGVGIYGVTAYTVARRSREIGVRMALGATPRDVLTLVVRQGLVLAGAGIGAGLLIAFAVSRLVAGMLYGIGPGDPVTYAGAAAIFIVMTVAASWAPARRAAATDPIDALRTH
jgi:predicted permease